MCSEPRTFISIRVSTKEQAVDGTSLPTQIRECLAYCRMHDLTQSLHPESNVNSPGVFADPGVSAWKVSLTVRPGFLEIMQRAKPGDTVIFYSIDRAFRSMSDFLKSYEVLRERGINLRLVRGNISMDTAAGSLWTHVQIAFAQYQSAIISERVKEANAIRKLRRQEMESAGIKAEETPVIRRKRREERTDEHDSHSRAADDGADGSSSQVYTEAVTDDIRRICTFGAKKREERASERCGRVFRYIRVSTGEQNPETQRGILARSLEFYTEQGYQDGGEFVDHGVSAYYTPFADRPAGKELCSQLQPGDLIVVVRIDRIFRSTIDLGLTFREWDQAGVMFADITTGLSTDTPMGKAMAGFMCLMAQWESDSISWRTKLAAKHLHMEKGPWRVGQTPQWVHELYSTLSDGKSFRRLEVDRRVVRDMVRMISLVQSGLTANEISDLLQVEHEIEEDLPFHVPRCGLQSRHAIEQRLRMRDRFEDLKKVRAYCDRNGVGWNGVINRLYSIDDRLIEYLVRDVRNPESVFNRYVEANEELSSLVV